MREPALLAAAATAFAITAAGTWAFRRFAFAWGLVDRPNQRSSHARDVARGGGAVLIAATLAGLAVACRGWTWRADIAALLAGLLVVAGVGLWDDRWTLSPWARLPLHFVAAALVAAATGGIELIELPGPLAVPLALPRMAATLWIVAVVNFYNFLDGVDGLAGSQGLITGTGLAVAGWDPFAAVCGAAVAGACGGFLLHNWAPARVFLGDVGSGALGFLFAAAPLLAPSASRPRAVVFVAISLWLFLADAAWTLLHRIARGERWHEAHREHLYQLLVRAGWSHSRVTVLVTSGSLLLTVVALQSWRAGTLAWEWTALAASGLCFGVEHSLARGAAR